MEENTYGFCIKGELPLICREPIFTEFPDQKNNIAIILEYFKKYLPIIMNRKTDYYNKPIKIDPKDIGLILQKDYGNYVILIVPTDDNSTYADERFYQEDFEYAYQIQVQVRANDAEESLENIVKLQSGLKTLLINMDHNLGLITNIEGFSLEGVGIDDANNIIRQGTYRFSITGQNFRK